MPRFNKWPLYFRFNHTTPHAFHFSHVRYIFSQFSFPFIPPLNNISPINTKKLLITQFSPVSCSLWLLGINHS